jgi:hypothetical protein
MPERRRFLKNQLSRRHFKKGVVWFLRMDFGSGKRSDHERCHGSLLDLMGMSFLWLGCGIDGWEEGNL